MNSRAAEKIATNVTGPKSLVTHHQEAPGSRQLAYSGCLWISPRGGFWAWGSEHLRIGLAEKGK